MGEKQEEGRQAESIKCKGPEAGVTCDIGGKRRKVVRFVVIGVKQGKLHRNPVRTLAFVLGEVGSHCRLGREVTRSRNGRKEMGENYKCCVP